MLRVVPNWEARYANKEPRVFGQKMGWVVDHLAQFACGSLGNPPVLAPWGVWGVKGSSLNLSQCQVCLFSPGPLQLGKNLQNPSLSNHCVVTQTPTLSLHGLFICFFTYSRDVGKKTTSADQVVSISPVRCRDLWWTACANVRRWLRLLFWRRREGRSECCDGRLLHDDAAAQHQSGRVGDLKPGWFWMVPAPLMWEDGWKLNCTRNWMVEKYKEVHFASQVKVSVWALILELLDMLKYNKDGRRQLLLKWFWFGEGMTVDLGLGKGWNDWDWVWSCGWSQILQRKHVPSHRCGVIRMEWCFDALDCCGCFLDSQRKWIQQEMGGSCVWWSRPSCSYPWTSK